MDDPRKNLILPDGVRSVGPDPAIARKLANLEENTVCGGRDGFIWDHGPRKNLAVTGYCVAPLCIDTGKCPAPRFVPHLPQYNELDQESETNRQRTMDISEAVAAVKELHRRARRRGAIADGRSDREIAKHVLTVWARMGAALKAGGDWLVGGVK